MKNKTLERLELEGNQLANESAAEFAKLIEVNRTI